MRTYARRVVAALIGAGCLLVGLPVMVGPAGADPISACTPTTGAIVAVDFGHWGGPIVRGCDAHPTTGIALLFDSGFTTAGTQHDGPQFLCRIGNAAWQGGTKYPTPATEKCVLTPPASAYWSFWLAPAGQDTWTYSPLGAYSDHPHAGEVEAWTFGGTDIGGSHGQPSFPPSAVRAKAATPPPATRTTHPAPPVRTTTHAAPPPRTTAPHGTAPPPRTSAPHHAPPSHLIPPSHQAAPSHRTAAPPTSAAVPKSGSIGGSHGGKRSTTSAQPAAKPSGAGQLDEPGRAGRSGKPDAGRSAAVRTTPASHAPGRTPGTKATPQRSGVPHASGSASSPASVPGGSARSAAPGQSVTAGSSSRPIVDAATAPAASKSSTGSLLPVLIAAILVVALGATAGTMAWRRRTR